MNPSFTPGNAGADMERLCQETQEGWATRRVAQAHTLVAAPAQAHPLGAAPAA